MYLMITLGTVLVIAATVAIAKTDTKEPSKGRYVGSITREEAAMRRRNPITNADRIVNNREQFSPFVTGGWVKEDWVKDERFMNSYNRLVHSPRLGEIEEIAWTNRASEGFLIHMKADGRYWTIRPGGSEEGTVYKLTDEPFGSMRGDGGPMPWVSGFRYNTTTREFERKD